MDTETVSTVTVTPVEQRDALFRQYPTVHQPQDVYVSLNCDTKTLSAAYAGDIGNALPMHVYNRRTLRWRIPALTADAANALLAEVLPFAETIVAGYACAWNGESHVGRYDDDADAAVESVSRLIEAKDFTDQTIVAWDAADWFGAVGTYDAQCRELGITAATTDEDLAVIEAREEANAAPNVITRTTAHLARLRDHARTEAEVS